MLLMLAWNIKSLKKAYQDFKIDINALPLGLLQKEKIRKSHAYLTEIQKLLISEGSANLKPKSL